MQQSKKYGTMKNRLKTIKNTNPVAKALMTSTEINAKPSKIPSKKKYVRRKEEKKWRKIL